MKVKNDHRSKFPNLSNWKEELSFSPDFFFVMATMVNVVTHIFFEIQTRPILVLLFVSDYETQLNITQKM